MKKILLIVLSLLTMTPLTHSQNKNDKENDTKIVLLKENNSDNYYYEDIVNVEGLSKEEIFKRAKQWVLSNLKTGDNNIQSDDQNFSIINSPTILIKEKKYKLGIFASAYVNFKINVQCKDGRYKFRFDNIIVKSTAVENYSESAYSTKIVSWKKYNAYLIAEINKSLFNLASNLEQAIKTGNNSSSNDDNW